MASTCRRKASAQLAESPASKMLKTEQDATPDAAARPVPRRIRRFGDDASVTPSATIDYNDTGPQTSEYRAKVVFFGRQDLGLRESFCHEPSRQFASLPDHTMTAQPDFVRWPERSQVLSKPRS